MREALLLFLAYLEAGQHKRDCGKVYPNVVSKILVRVSYKCHSDRTELCKALLYLYSNSIDAALDSEISYTYKCSPMQIDNFTGNVHPNHHHLTQAMMMGQQPPPASTASQLPPSPLSQRRLQQMAAESSRQQQQQQQRHFNDSRGLMIHEEEEEPLIPPR